MKGKISNGEFLRPNATRIVRGALVTAIAASALALPTASSASAQTIKPAGVAVSGVDEACRSHGRNFVVRQYFRGVAKYTLRCGTSTWGWKHIKKRHGWNNGMDRKISSAISAGAPNGRGGFSLYTAQCPPVEKFRTLIGTPAGINDLLTAYNVTNLAAGRC
ncbi:hypothetical protein [Streptomyces nigrescens]|uniref:hypothetical protein n=1 Tax=Streptomyces nigrescens TaxID=1920 RepID=UPI00348FA5BE